MKNVHIHKELEFVGVVLTLCTLAQSSLLTKFLSMSLLSWSVDGRGISTYLQDYMVSRTLPSAYFSNQNN